MFTIGGLLTFLGFVCTILFRNPQFLLLIIVGSLFLTGLFFYTYFSVFSVYEQANRRKKTQETYKSIHIQTGSSSILSFFFLGS